MTASPPRLLLVAHGTRSAAGSETTARIATSVAAARPGLRVDLCYLDVTGPTLADALATIPRDEPVVLVPMLLSTGYHVQHDIPTAVVDHPQVKVARHLGPHPLLSRAVLDRLRGAGGQVGTPTVMVGAGSTRAGADAELAQAARLLSAEVHADVVVRTVADIAAPAGASQVAQPAQVAQAAQVAQVATYLLAEGQFNETIASTFGAVPVGAPIGPHPALLELILLRYDAAAR